MPRPVLKPQLGFGAGLASFIRVFSAASLILVHVVHLTTRGKRWILNHTVALALKDVKHLIEARRFPQARRAAEALLLVAPVHDRALLHHRTAMASAHMADEAHAARNYGIAERLLDELDSPDTMARAILDRDRAMFEVTRAPWGGKQEIAGQWLEQLQADCHQLERLDQSDHRVAKELRVTQSFFNRLHWFMDVGHPTTRHRIVDDFRAIDALCQEDGTKLIYSLDALRWSMRVTRPRTSLAPDSRRLYAANLSAKVGDLRGAIQHLTVGPALESVYAVGVGVMRRFD